MALLCSPLSISAALHFSHLYSLILQATTCVSSLTLFILLHFTSSMSLVLPLHKHRSTTPSTFHYVSELPHRFPLLASLPSQKFPIGPAGCGTWAGESMCDFLARRKFIVPMLYQTNASVQCWGRTNTPCSSLGLLTLALVL